MFQYLVRLLRLHTWLFRKLLVLNNTSHQTRHDIGLAVLAGSDCMETVLQMKRDISANTFTNCKSIPYRMVEDNQEFQEYDRDGEPVGPKCPGSGLLYSLQGDEYKNQAKCIEPELG